MLERKTDMANDVRFDCKDSMYVFVTIQERHKEKGLQLKKNVIYVKNKGDRITESQRQCWDGGKIIHTTWVNGCLGGYLIHV